MTEASGNLCQPLLDLGSRVLRTPDSRFVSGTHPHDLRPTAASIATGAGANPKAVQRMLGHASAAMTLDTYADLFEDDPDAVSDRMNQARANALVGFLKVSPSRT